MRRLMTSIAAMCLLSGAVGCCKHMAGTCDCDCCNYSCCGCYGCFEGCNCCCAEPAANVPTNAMPGDPAVYMSGHGYIAPQASPYISGQPVYQPEYVNPGVKVETGGKVVNQGR